MKNALALPWIGVEIDRSHRPIRYTLVALIMAFVMLISGYACNVQTWVNNIETILQEVTPAIQIIISILPLLGTKIPTTLQSEVTIWQPKVEADVTNLGALIQQYQGDLATNTTAQAKINALIATTQADVLSILPDFNVLDPASQAKVVDTINVIANAIASVETIINNLEGTVSAKRASPTYGYPLIKDGNAFKKQWNGCMSRNFGTAGPHLY